MIERLESEIRLLLNKLKRSLEGQRDNIVALLKQADKELCNIKALWQQTFSANETLDSIKTRAHE